MSGLLGERNDDTTGYLYDLLYGNRSRGVPVGDGPVSGYLSESRPTAPGAAEREQQEPDRMARVGVAVPLGGELQARVNAAMQTPGQPGATSTLSPSVGLGYGPLSLSGGVDYRRDPDTNEMVRSAPHLGANLNVPLFGGNASVGGSLTPDQWKEFHAAFRKELSPQEEIALILNHLQPNEGTPDTRFGVAYKRRF